MIAKVFGALSVQTIFLEYKILLLPSGFSQTNRKTSITLRYRLILRQYINQIIRLFLLHHKFAYFYWYWQCKSINVDLLHKPLHVYHQNLFIFNILFSLQTDILYEATASCAFPDKSVRKKSSLYWKLLQSVVSLCLNFFNHVLSSNIYWHIWFWSNFVLEHNFCGF